MKFYEKFPYFDWKFYIDIYPDLRKAGIDTAVKAAHHYLKYGYNENRRTHIVITKSEKIYKIPFENFIDMAQQSYFSSGVFVFKERIQKKYKLINYNNLHNPCLFFGMYNNTDLIKIQNHKGLRILIWCGEDANHKNIHSTQTMNEIKKLNNVIHISKSISTFNSLKEKDIYNILVDYDIVDRTLFYPIEKNKLGKKIFIFNGQKKGREQIYGKQYYTEVIKILSGFEYIFSNTLNVDHGKMPEIYKQCFIMLRLTEHDGNANSVQECNSMMIPVIHNQSDYGLKWKTVDDIIHHIIHYVSRQL